MAAKQLTMYPDWIKYPALQKHDSGWSSVQIVSISGGFKPQSSLMPGGLFQIWIYLLVLTGIGINIGENLTSFPVAICIKKSAKRIFLIRSAFTGQDPHSRSPFYLRLNLDKICRFFRWVSNAALALMIWTFYFKDEESGPKTGCQGSLGHENRGHMQRKYYTYLSSPPFFIVKHKFKTEEV